jgi:hypothetical protein
MFRFCKAIITAFSATHLRYPTEEDFQIQMKINAARGFPGMFASLDVTHWT